MTNVWGAYVMTSVSAASASADVDSCVKVFKNECKSTMVWHIHFTSCVYLHYPLPVTPIHHPTPGARSRSLIPLQNSCVKVALKFSKMCVSPQQYDTFTSYLVYTFTIHFLSHPYITLPPGQGQGY